MRVVVKKKPIEQPIESVEIQDGSYVVKLVRDGRGWELRVTEGYNGVSTKFFADTDKMREFLKEAQGFVEQGRK